MSERNVIDGARLAEFLSARRLRIFHDSDGQWKTQYAGNSRVMKAAETVEEVVRQHFTEEIDEEKFRIREHSAMMKAAEARLDDLRNERDGLFGAIHV